MTSLFDYLKDLRDHNNSHSLRLAAVEALVKLDDPRIVFHLIDALKDRNLITRKLAARALGRLGDPQAIVPLISVLQDIEKDPKVQEAHFLVVEDNVPNFVLIARMLAFMGAQHCEWKTSGWQVVTFAEMLPRVDLILMDLLLPYESGYQALQKIRAHKRLKNTLIVAVTGHTGESEIHRAKLAGFDGFIGKPIDPDYFPSQIIRILNGESVWEWRPLRSTLGTNPLAEDVQGALVNIGAATIPFVIELLESKKSFERLFAAEVLDKLDWQPNLNEEQVRYWIAKQNWDKCIQVGKLAVDPFINLLQDENKNIRKEIMSVLGKLGNIRAVDPLINCLHDNDSEVRAVAAKTLGKLGDIRAVDPLINCLHDLDLSTRESAVIALGQINDPKTVEALLSILTSENKFVRASAAKVLGELGDTQAIDPLINCLHDLDFSIRESAVIALGQINDPKTAEALLSILASENKFVRASAAKVLGELRDTRAVDPLINCLHDNDNVVRTVAAEALGKFGDTRAVDRLINCLYDPIWMVRRAAASALEKLGWRVLNDELGIQYWIAKEDWDKCIQVGEKAVTQLIDMLDDKNPDIIAAVARTLGKLGDRRAITPLIKLLQDKDDDRYDFYSLFDKPNVRASVADALGEFRDVQSIDSLIKTLYSTDQSAREAAAAALGQINDPKTVEALLSILTSENKFVRASAAKVLGNLQDDHATEPLTKLLYDKAAEVRWAAASVLEKLGWRVPNDELGIQYWIAKEDWDKCIQVGERAVTPLIDMLDDVSEKIRREVIKTLGELGNI